jgi:hypothetical protein
MSEIGGQPPGHPHDWTYPVLCVMAICFVGFVGFRQFARTWSVPVTTLAPGDHDGTTPYYQMNNSDRERLLSAADSVRIGETRQRVLEIMGPPTRDWHEETDYPSPTLRYERMEWPLRIWKHGLANLMEDEFIDVILDEKEKVVLEVEVFLKPRSLGRPTTRRGEFNGDSAWLGKG